jgi:hypothetical protein
MYIVYAGIFTVEHIQDSYINISYLPASVKFVDILFKKWINFPYRKDQCGKYVQISPGTENVRQGLSRLDD